MLKISDQFCFGLKTLIPVSNLTYQIYLTHNLIKTIHTFLHYDKKHTSQTKNLLNSIATPKTPKNDPFLDLNHNSSGVSFGVSLRKKFVLDGFETVKKTVKVD